MHVVRLFVLRNGEMFAYLCNVSVPWEFRAGRVDKEVFEGLDKVSQFT